MVVLAVYGRECRPGNQLVAKETGSSGALRAYHDQRHGGTSGPGHTRDKTHRSCHRSAGPTLSQGQTQTLTSSACTVGARHRPILISG